ncbi:MAG: hypothetical protein ABF293_12345 [Flavobacteriaceae bacterium]
MRWRDLPYMVLSILIFISCEEVTDVDTPSDSSRLMVEGLTRAVAADPLFQVRIIASYNNNFFEEIPVTDLDSKQLMDNLKWSDIFPLGNFTIKQEFG